MKSRCFVFVRKSGAPLAGVLNGGHVGWGFQVGEDRFYYGSTENRSGSPFVAPGEDNDWWAADGTEAEMLARFIELDYDGYKVATVREPHPEAARRLAEESQQWGYTGLTNNCLDHLWRILEAYGEPWLPFAQTHPIPNDWFAQYLGEYRNL